MIRVLIASAIILPTFIYSLLPPLYETLAEFRALINDERLPKSLESGDVILNIERQQGQFFIHTNKRTLVVPIIYEPAQIGPARFHLEFDHSEK